MSQISRPGWNAFVSKNERGGKKVAVLHYRNLLIIMSKMGAEAVAADRLFSTSVISNGWNHVACVWISLCMDPFIWPYDKMLVESSTDLDDDSSCSIWPLKMSEDLIVSNCKGLVEPQSLNISGPSIHPVKEPSRKHCF